MLGRDPGRNMNGSDFIPKIMDLYKGRDIALLGTDEKSLERAVDKITAQDHNPVLSTHGFHEEYTYVRGLSERPVALTILAMGMPKQERVAALIAHDLAAPNLIVCGGAILDFIGGKISRAPRFIRAVGLEWLYRLMQEPV